MLACIVDTVLQQLQSLFCWWHLGMNLCKYIFTENSALNIKTVHLSLIPYSFIQRKASA